MSKIEQQYKDAQEQRKAKIKAEPNKHKRFWKWARYFIAFPFIWIWANIRDWRTAVIFVIVFLVVSSEVRIPYLLAFCFGVSSTTGKYLIGIATACWSFWLLPGTPFIVICISLTIMIKAIINKISKKH